jgi:hypothetical protein
MSSIGVSDAAEARAAQVRRVLGSRTFHATEVLKRLLDYLARQALESHAGDLKEYTIGVEAFGKPADYDPQTDSSVRVQIGKLRQKLDEYYRLEGAEDEIVIELPKGHFKLEFRTRQPDALPHSPVPAVPPGPPPRPVRFLGVPPWMWITGIAAALLLSIPFMRSPANRSGTAAGPWTPAMEEFWRPFLAGPRPVMISIGAPLFIKMGNDFFRDPSVNSWDASSQPSSVQEVQRAVGAGNASPAFVYTGIGEAEGAFEIQRLLLPRGRELAFRASNQLTWEDIGRNNMIFIGPPKYNPQTLDLPVQQDFEISHARVQSLRPAPGEPTTFEEKWSPDHVHLDEGHALISRLPGLHGEGEMLILAGNCTECSRAAVEYVTRPEYVDAFMRRMHEKGGMPRWFQVVIRARFKSQTPIAIEMAAFHPLKKEL